MDHSNGLYQIISPTTYKLSSNTSPYCVSHTTSNTTQLTKLMEDTLRDMKKQLNRLMYFDPINYSDYIVSKGTKKLPDKIDIFKLM